MTMKGGMRISGTESDFPRALKRWRLERALTQRDLGLPASTVAEWERGRRRPRGPEQIHRLAKALALPVETVYQALGQSPPADEPVPTDDLEAWFNVTRIALLHAYRTGDTAALAASEQHLKEIGPKISERAASEFLAGHAMDPLALVDLGGMLFRSNQWRAANILLEGALRTLPANSPLRTRIYSNLGMVYAALGDLEVALHHDERYLQRAVEQNDGWLAALAHAQWIEHQMQERSPHPDREQHLEAIHRWNASAVQPDPFLETWEEVAQVQIALSEDRAERVAELLQRVGTRVAKHPELAVEDLAISVVKARAEARYGSPQRAVTQLKTTLTESRGHYALSERMLASQWLCRMAIQAKVSWAQGAQLALVNQYIGLGAVSWATRLAREWQLDFEAWLDMDSVDAAERPSPDVRAGKERSIDVVPRSRRLRIDQ